MDAVQKLSDKLKSCVNDDRNFHVNPKTIIKNTQWGASFLLSEILFYAKKEPKFSDKDLIKFHKEYEETNKVHIEILELIDKQWIRNINGEIRLPNAITRALWAFRKNSENESVGFPQYIAENIDIFKFLYSLHITIGYSDSRKVLIEEEQLKEIITKHRICFPLTPILDELLSELDIEKYNNKYEIRIGYDYNGCWSTFSDEISARLWERLSIKYPQNRIVSIFDEWFEKSLWCKNPCKHLSEDSKKKLLGCIWNKLISEPDLECSNKELAKVYLDSHHFHHNWENDIILPERHKINNQSYVELYKSLHEIENHFHDAVSYQEIRVSISFLIRLIIENDKAYHEGGEPFCKIKELLKISLGKPFIFYELLQILKRQHSYILPYFLNEKGVFLVVFDLLSEISITDILLDENKDYQEQSRQKQITQILLKSIDAYLQKATTYMVENEEIAKNISAILYSTSRKLFSQINVNNYHSNLFEKEEYKQRFNEMLNCITSFESSITRNFFDDIYPSLFSCIEKINRPLQTHAVIHGIYFPKYYLISELLKNKKISSDNNKELLQLFINSLKKEIELDIIEIQDYWYDKKEQKAVSWSDNQYGYGLIDWAEIFLLAEKYSIVDDLLESFKAHFKTNSFKEETKEWNLVHDWNRSQTYKLRLLMRILLIAYSKINEKGAFYENVGFNIEEVQNILERKIVYIAINSNKSNFEKAEYGIFSDSFESLPNVNTNLFSKLGEISNFFSQENRRKLIDSFLENEDAFEKFMELYNLLFLEGDRQYLKEKLDNISPKKYIENAHWLPQLENALIQAINSDLFTEQAEEILNYYEKIADTRFKNDENKVNFIYRIKLLLAYRHNNKSELLNINVPEKRYHISTFNKEAANQKTFYLSLFDLKEKNFSDALNKLKNLTASEPINVEFFIRKCYVELLIADKRKETDVAEARNQYQMVIQNIHEYSFPENQYYNKTLLDFVMLQCYSNLDSDDSNFYNLFSQLNLSQKIDEGYLKLAVQSFLNWREYHKASSIIEEARNFHILPNGAYPKFINDLEKELGTDDNIRRLQSSFQEILSLTFEDLTKIIPKRINKYTEDYREFIAYEIVLAFGCILEKVKTVQKLRDEDSYSDLLEILLNARIKIFGRDGFSSQNRSGSSAAGKSIGSLDLKMTLDAKNIIIEALRWHNANFNSELQRHLTKTFNYDSTRVAFYNVMYYEKDAFYNDWIKFKDRLFPKLTFPKEYFLVEDLADLSSKFGNNSVKIAVSKHDKNLRIYHILINIKYITCP